MRLLEAPVNDPMQRIQHYIGSSGIPLLKGPGVDAAGPAQQGQSSSMSGALKHLLPSTPYDHQCFGDLSPYPKAVPSRLHGGSGLSAQLNDCRVSWPESLADLDDDGVVDDSFAGVSPDAVRRGDAPE